MVPYVVPSIFRVLLERVGLPMNPHATFRSNLHFYLFIVRQVIWIRAEKWWQR